MTAKKFLSTLCAFAMVLSLFAPGGMATEASATETGHVHNCGHAEHTVTGTWRPLSSLTDNKTESVGVPAGNYYLDKDITLVGGYLALGDGTTNLCLNGHSLNGADGKDYIIQAFKNTTAGNVLNICDCSEKQNGTIGNWTSGSNSFSSTIIARANAQVNVYGGNFTGTSGKCVFYAAKDGTITMYGGKIYGNNSQYCVNITDGGRFVLEGGRVSENKTQYAGVINATGHFTMNGGVVSANNYPDTKGHISGTEDKIALNGGIVTDDHYHDCGHDHGITGTWVDLNSMTSPGSTLALTAGNYYLNGDYTGKYMLATSGSGTINLCLNGYSLSGKNIPSTTKTFIRTDDSTTLNILDCSDNQSGTISGFTHVGDDTATNSSVIVARASDVVNLYGGTITGNTAASVVAGVNEFNMYGGKIVDNDVRNSVIYVHTFAGSVVTMEGGEVSGNRNTHASNGAVSVSSGGTFNMKGGTIIDNAGNNATQITGNYTYEGGTVGHIHSCDHDHDDFGGNWKPLSSVTNGMTANKAIPAGNYYLDQDIELAGGHLSVGSNATVNLCLNGHNIIGTPAFANLLYLNGNKGTLNVCDCSEGETGSLGKGWSSSTSTTANTNRVYSVVRTGTASTTGNVFNLYGGSIAGATVGSVVMVMQDNTFNMHGGKLVDNVCQGGGGTVVTCRGTFNMTGGEISNNSVNEHSSRGAVTVVDMSAAEVVISGGMIATNDDQAIASDDDKGGSVTIIGGRFSKAPNADYVAEGYSVKATGDATYGYEVIKGCAHSEKVAIGEAVAPTCSATGMTAGEKCAACGETITAQVEIPVDANAHPADELVDVDPTAPTCEGTGLTAGKKCEACGVFTVPQTPVDALGHDYVPVVTEPTCEAGGYTTYTCKNDATHTYTGNATEAKGHDWNEGVITTEPTYEAEGVRTFTCQNDANHTYTESVDKLVKDAPMNVEDFKGGETVTAPTKAGYVFAGWYADANHANAYTANTGSAYAKFVDQRVLSVKAQITAGTNAGSEKTDLRLLSTVDDLNYREVGFKITFNGRTVKVSTRTVFSSIVAKDGGVAFTENPSIFCEQSKYFITYTITDIPNAQFNADFVVTPYWITLDGTEFDGITNTLQVSKGFAKG